MRNEEAYELFLFGTNDAQLYRSRITPIIDNLKKKIVKGKYDHTLALKLWRYAADDAAKRYNKEHMGTTAGYGIFTVPVRNEVAKQFQDYYEEELRYAKNPAPRLGTKRPRRVSQVTKKLPTTRLVKRRKANIQPGYFPNPVAVYDKYVVFQKAPNGKLTRVCATDVSEFASVIADLLNSKAAKGARFIIEEV
jgi:hypothetical protein